ncbi:hypothetical protein K439DRAFT_1620889 [Ramaria rubella]|nr:hypothetical protein K439DRAFT_1620889 [Ramaria rubella]
MRDKNLNDVTLQVPAELNTESTSYEDSNVSLTGNETVTLTSSSGESDDDDDYSPRGYKDPGVVKVQTKDKKKEKAKEEATKKGKKEETTKKDGKGKEKEQKGSKMG